MGPGCSVDGGCERNQHGVLSVSFRLLRFWKDQSVDKGVWALQRSDHWACMGLYSTLGIFRPGRARCRRGSTVCRIGALPFCRGMREIIERSFDCVR